MKAVSESTINQNHWNAERQGYIPRLVLVTDEVRIGLERDIQNIIHLITKEYYLGVDSKWLQSLIEEYHHPNINSRGGNKSERYYLVYQIQKPLDETPLTAQHQKHRNNIKKLARYEQFLHEVKGKKTPKVRILGSSISYRTVNVAVSFAALCTPDRPSSSSGQCLPSP